MSTRKTTKTKKNGRKTPNPRRRAKRMRHLPQNIRDNHTEIISRLDWLRGDRSQRGWAIELGIPQQNICRYLTAGTTPHLDFIVHIGKREGVNLNWLLLGAGRRTR